MAIRSILFFLPGAVLLAEDEPTDPEASLPWLLVVGSGVLVILLACILLFALFKVFPRGRRLDAGKKLQNTQEPEHHKKRYPRADWPLREIDDGKK